MEPWNEEVYQQLMWLLAQNGERSAALRAFEQCRMKLAVELDVEPRSATLSLWALIRDGAEELGVLRNPGGGWLPPTSVLTTRAGESERESVRDARPEVARL